MSNDPVTVTSEFSGKFSYFWLFCNVKSRWWFCFQQCALHPDQQCVTPCSTMYEYITPSSSMFVIPSSRVFVTPSSRVFVTNCDRLWLETVLWIHDISVRIRILILILGLVPFPNGSRSGTTSGSVSCFFRQRPTKNNLVSKDFLLITFWRYINISIQSKKSQKELNKIVKVKVFLTFFTFQLRIRIRTSNDGSGRPENIRIHNTG
jgi:hypothetical protein